MSDPDPRRLKPQPWRKGTAMNLEGDDIATEYALSRIARVLQRNREQELLAEESLVIIRRAFEDYKEATDAR